MHRLLTEGVDVEYQAADGALTAGKVMLIDFARPERNDWLAVGQFTVVGAPRERRPDVVVFVNGLPLVVIELKAPGSEGAHVLGAFNQLQTYKQQIPQLFHTNALLVASDGLVARAGSLSADFERFMPWRTTDGERIAPKGAPELSTLVEGARTAPSARPAARFHGVRRHRRRAGEDHRRLPPVSRRGQGGRIDGARVGAVAWRERGSGPLRPAERARAGGGRPARGGDLAYAGIGQEPADGVLCRPVGETPRHAEPDAGGTDRPQ